MRAGLLQRPGRNRRLFLPSPPIRPERAALSGEPGFLRGLEAALRAESAPTSRPELRAAVAAGAEGVAPVLARLAEAGRQPEGEAPAIVIPVDQAEELFLSDERASAEARAFLSLPGALLTRTEPAIVALATIRTDAYEPLQSAPELNEVRQEPFSLAPKPRGAYRAVISGPAERMEKAGRKLAIEPPLVDALLTDIDEGAAKDAPPLLAFTMERLFEEHGADGDLKLSEHRGLGRVVGSIEAAVEGALRAMDGDERIPRRAAARRWTGRRTPARRAGAHAGERLAEAGTAAGREDVGALLDPTDRAYLAERRRDADARQARELAQATALAAARRRSARSLAGGDWRRRCCWRRPSGSGGMPGAKRSGRTVRRRRRLSPKRRRARRTGWRETMRPARWRRCPPSRSSKGGRSRRPSWRSPPGRGLVRAS